MWARVSHTRVSHLVLTFFAEESSVRTESHRNRRDQRELAQQELRVVVPWDKSETGVTDGRRRARS